jgi:hypothetical protein
MQLDEATASLIELRREPADGRRVPGSRARSADTRENAGGRAQGDPARLATSSIVGMRILRWKRFTDLPSTPNRAEWSSSSRRNDHSAQLDEPSPVWVYLATEGVAALARVTLV